MLHCYLPLLKQGFFHKTVKPNLQNEILCLDMRRSHEVISPFPLFQAGCPIFRLLVMPPQHEFTAESYFHSRFKTATQVLAFRSCRFISTNLHQTDLLFAFLLLNWVVLTSPTTIRALSLTNWVVNLWIKVLACMFDFGMDRFDTLFVLAR